MFTETSKVRDVAKVSLGTVDCGESTHLALATKGDETVITCIKPRGHRGEHSGHMPNGSRYTWWVERTRS